MVLVERIDRSSLLEALQVSNVDFECVNSLLRVFLLGLLARNLLVGLRDLTLQRVDFVHLRASHADRSAHACGLLEDAVIEVLAALDEVLLCAVRIDKRIVGKLVFRAEFLEILVADDLLQELLELLLQDFEGLLIEAQVVDLAISGRLVHGLVALFKAVVCHENAFEFISIAIYIRDQIKC